MDLTAPCSACSPWRYSRADSTLYRWNVNQLVWEQVAAIATGDGNGIISQLPLGDVSIVGDSSELSLMSTSLLIDGTLKVGEDSSFYHNPLNNTTVIDGSMSFINSTNFEINAVGTYAPFIRLNNSAKANASVFTGYVLTNDFGAYTNPKGFAYGIGPYSDRINYQWSFITRWDSVGTDGWSSDLIYGANFTKTSHLFRGGASSIRGAEFNFLTRAAVGNTPSLRVYNGAVNFFAVLTNGQTIIKNRITGNNFTVIDPIGDSTLIDGTLRLSDYGSGNKSASALSKTTTGRVAVFASDGTFLDGGPRIFTGTGSPETVITAPVGSLYTNTTGGAGTTLYIKESGTGNTGWVAK